MELTTTANGTQTTRDSTDQAGRRTLSRPRFGMLALEPRFMFDGAAVVDAAHAAPDAAAKALIPDAPAAVEVRAADPAKDNGKKEVVFVDTSVADYKTLEAGVRAGVGIVEIDGSKDGLAQIAKWAETNGGYDAIHILSHGGQGVLNLGTNTVTDTTLTSAVAQAELAELGHALNAGGDLLLYGCDVAAGSGGTQFVADLATATGADVAASTDVTGATALGGDWVLETSTGQIDAVGLLSSSGTADYHHLLATLDFSTATGDGTSSVSETVGDITLTATLSDGNWTVSSGGGWDQWFAGSDTLSDPVIVASTYHTSETFTFNRPVNLTSFLIGRSTEIDTLIFTPIGGSNTSVTQTVDGNGIKMTVNWTGITGFTVTKSGGGSFKDMVYDTFIATGVGPAITSTDTASFAENGSGTVYTATGSAAGGGGSLVFDALSGTDASLFYFNTTTGVLTFILPPDYETPLDSGGNNVYNVTINAHDSLGSNSKDVAITVTNVNEAPTLTTISTLTGASEDTAYAITYASLTAAANESDVDTASLSFRVEAVSSGTLYTDAGLTTQVTPGSTLLGTGGTWYWKPASDANGSALDAFTVKAYDGALASATAIQVKVDVAVVNDKPTATAGATLAYTENGSAAVIDNSITLADVDDTQMSGATITLSAGFTSGDVLGFSTQNGISGSYNSGTGVLTLSGAATVANYQTALRSVTFSSSSDGPTATSASRTITWTATDAGASGSAQTSTGVTSTVNITAVNDKPVATAGGTLAYTENGSAAAIDATLTLTDADDTQMSGATVTISSGYTAGDVLGFTNQNGISGSYDSGTGVLTLTGTTTVANYQTALRSVTFNSISETPTATSTSRTITWAASDAAATGSNGIQTSTGVSSTINVSAVNNAPTLIVPASISVTEDVAAAITGISFADVDAGSSSVTVTLAVGSGTLAASTGGSVTVGGSGSDTLTLTGSVANINAFITGSNVSFTTATNATGAVTLTSTINDGGNTGSGGAHSDSNTTTINVTAIADTPSITAASTTPGTQTVTGLVISRNTADGSEVTYFKITGITGGSLFLNNGTTAIYNGDFISYADAHAGLRFTPSGSSNGSFDLQASTSNLDAGLGGSLVTATITVGVGVDSPTIAEDNDSGAIAISGDTAYYKITGITGGTLYSDASFTTPITEGTFIATAGATTNVYFRPTADFNGSAGFSVQGSTTSANGGLTGNTATSDISVSAVNDAPTITVPGSVSVNEDVASAISGISFADVDASNGSVTATLAVDSGTLAASSSGGVGVTGSGSSTLTLTGSITNINTFIANSHVTFTTDANATAAVTLSTSIDDGGNTGSGGAKTDSATTTINVTAVNDAPIVTVPGSISVTEDIAAAITGISFADVDAGNNSVTATLAVDSGRLAASSGGGVTVTGSDSGTLTLTGSITNINTFIANSHVTFTTAANATGAVTLTSSINDGGNTGSGGAKTDSATTAINVTAVNNAPVVTVPGSVSVSEDVASAITGINFADVDAGSSSVTATLAVDSGTLAASNSGGVTVTGSGSGTLTLIGSITNINTFIANSHVTFTTAANATAAVTLSTSIDDGGNTGSGGTKTDSATTTINVTAVNDAPIVTVPGSISVTEDVAGAITGIYFADADAGNSSVTATLAVDSGTLAATSSGGVTVTGSGSGTITLTGSITNINSFIANSHVTFTTATNATSAVTLTSSINDGGNTGSGGAKTDSATTSFTVAAVNDAPVAGTIGNQNATETQPFTFTVPAGSFSDPDNGDHLTYSATLANGSPLPGWLTFDPITRTFSGTPGNGDLGSINLRVTATDGGGLSTSATFAIQVTSPLIPPLIQPSAPSTPPPSPPVEVPALPTPPRAAIDFLPTGSALSLNNSLAGTDLPPATTVSPSAPATAGNSPTDRPTPAGTPAFHVATAPADSSTALIVNHGVADAQIPTGGHLETSIPSDAFAHTDPNATVVLSLRQADGRPLPAWVRFNPATGKLLIDPPPGYEGRLTLRLNARDSSGHEATTIFRLVIGQRQASDGRTSLNTQLQEALRPTSLASRLAALAAHAHDVLRPHA